MPTSSSGSRPDCLHQRVSSGRLDELGEVVRALGQHLQYVFSADNRQQVSLRIAVDGREEDLAAGFDQAGAGFDDTRRIGDVLEHFQASHGIEGGGHLIGHLLGGNLAVIDLLAAFQQVQPGDAERLLREIDSRDFGPADRHTLGKQAAAAANIEDALARQADGSVYPVEAQWIDVVQRLELAVRIPPAMGEVAELFEFGWIGVEHVRP